MVKLDRMTKLMNCINRFAVGTIDPMDVVPELVQELQQMREELADMIYTLPNATERTVMILAYLKGFNKEAIATGGECSQRMVYNYLKSAKKHLQEIYPDRITTS